MVAIAGIRAGQQHNLCRPHPIDRGRGGKLGAVGIQRRIPMQVQHQLNAGVGLQIGFHRRSGAGISAAIGSGIVLLQVVDHRNPLGTEGIGQSLSHRDHIIGRIRGAILGGFPVILPRFFGETFRAVAMYDQHRGFSQRQLPLQRLQQQRLQFRPIAAIRGISEFHIVHICRNEGDGPGQLGWLRWGGGDGGNGGRYRGNDGGFRRHKGGGDGGHCRGGGRPSRPHGDATGSPLGFK